MKYLIASLLAIGVMTSPAYAQNEDKVKLTELLNEFLAKVDSKEMHDRFWAEDLTYTSSSGKRHGKETIMAGFSNSVNSSQEAGPSYWAEEIEIKLFGNVAVVAFKLMSKNNTGEETSYLNSGTFVKRNNQWKVVNWQATKCER